MSPGSPGDRLIATGAGCVFLSLMAVSTLVPGAERVLNSVAGWLLVLGIVAAVVAGGVWLALYIAGERALHWECVRPLEGLPDPDTGRPYVAPVEVELGGEPR